jgi:hypothetical protein
VFDTWQFPQFIHHVKLFKLLGVIKMRFEEETISVSFHSSIGATQFWVSIQCSGLLTHVMIMERICTQWPPLVSHVELLKLGGSNSAFKRKKWQEVITPWLGLLHRFTAMRTLRLHGAATVSHVAHILGELEGERATEVLPALRTIELSHSSLYLRRIDASETVHILESFLTAREEWEHPVVVNVGPKP